MRPTPLPTKESSQASVTPPAQRPRHILIRRWREDVEAPIGAPIEPPTSSSPESSPNPLCLHRHRHRSPASSPTGLDSSLPAARVENLPLFLPDMPTFPFVHLPPSPLLLSTDRDHPTLPDHPLNLILFPSTPLSFPTFLLIFLSPFLSFRNHLPHLRRPFFPASISTSIPDGSSLSHIPTSTPLLRLRFLLNPFPPRSIVARLPPDLPKAHSMLSYRLIHLRSYSSLLRPRSRLLWSACVTTLI